jgi:tRNA threonylcarbamoyl adenosine modification protein YeaZ
MNWINKNQITFCIDSSSHDVGVEILKGDRVLSVARKGVASFVSEIPPLITATLKEANIDPKQIDLYCALSGPGSWTGIRVGVTLVKSLAYAAKKPAIGIPAFALLAEQWRKRKTGNIAALVPARAGEVLFSVVDLDQPSFTPINQVRHCTHGTILNALQTRNISHGIWMSSFEVPEALWPLNLETVDPKEFPSGLMSSIANGYVRNGLNSNHHELHPDYFFPFPEPKLRVQSC